MGRVELSKDTPILSSQCQPSGFSLGYEPRFGWAWGRGIRLLSLARTYYMSLRSAPLESSPPRRFILPAQFLLHAALEGKTPPHRGSLYAGVRGAKSDQYWFAL